MEKGAGAREVLLPPALGTVALEVVQLQAPVETVPEAAAVAEPGWSGVKKETVCRLRTANDLMKTRFVHGCRNASRFATTGVAGRNLRHLRRPPRRPSITIAEMEKVSGISLAYICIYKA